MNSIDYENMFIYMSLVFAFCIFIILLFGCAFASGSRSGGQIYENFLNEDDKGDIKSQVVSLLTELEGKDTTSADDKKKLSDALEKINNNNISITELKTVIDLLKEMMPKTVSKKSSAATAKAPSSSASNGSSATAATAATAATDTAKSPTAPSSATSATAATAPSTDTAAATAPSAVAATAAAPSPP
jgi:hypothetical protein